VSVALQALAEQLRGEDTPIAPHVIDSAAPVEAADEYALVIEAVREGYLLHYGESRLLAGHDQDLALLAGDYLYALGLDRLAALGDTEAVAVLAELIARCAQLHAEGRGDAVDPLWDEAARRIVKSDSVGGSGRL
jgi:geranylgeranyl pyrophosphate synthase